MTNIHEKFANKTEGKVVLQDDIYINNSKLEPKAASTSNRKGPRTGPILKLLKLQQIDFPNQRQLMVKLAFWHLVGEQDMILNWHRCKFELALLQFMHIAFL